MLVAKLRQQGLNPYLVPVGGSSSLGVWGYLEMMRELQVGIQRDTGDTLRLPGDTWRSWRELQVSKGMPRGMPSWILCGVPHAKSPCCSCAVRLPAPVSAARPACCELLL